MSKRMLLKALLYVFLVVFFLALLWVPNFAYKLGLGAKDFEPEKSMIIFMTFVVVFGMGVAVFLVDKKEVP